MRRKKTNGERGHRACRLHEALQDASHELELDLRAEVEFTLASSEIRREDRAAFRELLERLAERYGEGLLEDPDEIAPPRAVSI